MATITPIIEKKEKVIRVWCDGCYDLVHYGHANQIRQAKAMGDWVVVGIHPDSEIEMFKGPPVFTQQERYRMIRSIKWVDEVVEGAPYIGSVEMLDKHNCDFWVHGDDPVVDNDGNDIYRTLKEAGRYKECQRTAGVSTTDLVGRMLLLTRQHHVREDKNYEHVDLQGQRSTSIGRDSSVKSSPFTGNSQFLPTTQKIMQFSDGKDPKPGDTIAYCAGAFDMFHLGHVDFLAKVAEQADYVIVGLQTDRDVNRSNGSNYPIMNLHERVLSALACRYVNEVVMGAPYDVTADLLDNFKIDLVFQGVTRQTPYTIDEKCDPYAEPKRRGIFRLVESGNKLTTSDLVLRILNHRTAFIERNRKKEAKELKYLTQMEVKQQDAPNNGTV